MKEVKEQQGGAGFSSTATLGCAGFAIVDNMRMNATGENRTAKSGCAT
jgi:hypothetical protein